MGGGWAKGHPAAAVSFHVPLKPGDRMEEKLIEVAWLPMCLRVLSSFISPLLLKISNMRNNKHQDCNPDRAGLSIFCWKYVLSRLWGLRGFVTGDWGLWLPFSLPDEKVAAFGISVFVVWQTWRGKYLWLRKQMRGWFLLKEMGIALSEVCSVTWQCVN